VYVLVPTHAGSGEITGAEAVNVLPQLSSTTGGVGATASAGHATVEEPAGGMVTTGAEIV
jgi:hypothetical protein